MHEFIPDGSGQYLDLYDSDTFWSCVSPHGGTDHEHDRLATAVGGCWQWLRSAGSTYGRFETHNGQEAAHRVAWKELGRELNEEHHLDHLCRNTKCVNPGHLEVVTHTENVRRGLVANKTHCKRGHELSGDNVRYITRGDRRYRSCKACRSQYARDHHQRNKDKRSA